MIRAVAFVRHAAGCAAILHTPLRSVIRTQKKAAMSEKLPEPSSEPARFVPDHEPAGSSGFLDALDAVPSFVYKILLVVATAIWGFSFVVMKDVVAALSPAWLLGIRFTCAGVILLIILRKRVRTSLSRRVIGMGALLGVFDFAAFFAQTVGLEHTTPGINAFLTATYCVIVPFAWWVISRKRPSIVNVGTAVLAVVGIWLVSVSGSASGFSIGFGEAATLVAALMFAVHIVFVSKFSQFADVLVLTVLQFVTEGLLGLLVGVCFETPPAASVFTLEIVGQMAFLIAFASIFCFGVQNIALAHVPPAQASLLLSLESVFGVVASVLLYGESLTVRLVAGFAIIFAAIVINEVVPARRQRTSDA